MRKLFTLAAIALIGFASCKNNDETAPQGEASLTIKLVPSVSRAVGTPTQADENEIKKFNVYIYDADILERVETVTGSLTATLTGLTAGAKKVVVIANLPASFPALTPGTNYSALADAANYIILDDQAVLTNGLVMSKEEVVLLTPTPTATLNIILERVVAKIKLGTVTLRDPADYTGTFVLESVYITKARSKSSVGIPTLVTTTPTFAGIMGTTANVQKTYLKETITEADFADRYFYVFACTDATNTNATMIGLQGKFDGADVYFPFRINDATPGWGGDGTFIARNTEHTININLKEPWTGSPDPEKPVAKASLDVTVSAKDWVVVPTQSMEW